MEVYYLCRMRLLTNSEYFIFNISGADAPKLSLSSRIFIGSSDSNTSITFKLKSKFVGKFINLSMSWILFCRY
jgi:hypothetical protein